MPSDITLSSRLPVSAILLSYNDERLIRAALDSVAGWVSEIFVVDSGSTDRTLEIVGEFAASVYSHPFQNYAAQRNWAQETLPLGNDWVFHLDADERVTPELHASLEQFFSGATVNTVDTVDGLLVARRTVFMGRWIRHGGHYPVYHLRIFRRSKGHCEDRLYDQHFVVDGQVIKLHGDLIDTITTSLDHWTQRHFRWADLEMRQQMAEQPAESDPSMTRASLTGNPIEQRRWLRAKVYNRQPLFWRSLVYFFYRYFIRLGFLDGTEGLIFHTLQGFWFRFYIDAKLWEARQPIPEPDNPRPPDRDSR